MSLFGLLLFCLLGTILGIILFKLVSEIRHTYKNVAGFLLKMDKKISLFEHFKFLKAFQRQNKILTKITQLKVNNSIKSMYRSYKLQKEEEYQNSRTVRTKRKKHFGAIYAKFEKELPIEKVSLGLTSFAIVVIINLPIIFNYFYTINLESQLKELRNVRSALEYKLGYTYTMFGISYAEF